MRVKFEESVTGWLPADRAFLAYAGISGAIAVAAAAYASHGLVDAPREQDWMRTASAFQILHALALTITVLLAGRAGRAARWALRLAACLYTVGSALFCGSLYALALSVSPVGGAAPLGGSALIAGWLALAVAALLPGWRADGRR